MTKTPSLGPVHTGRKADANKRTCLFPCGCSHKSVCASCIHCCHRGTLAPPPPTDCPHVGLTQVEAIRVGRGRAAFALTKRACLGLVHSGRARRSVTRGKIDFLLVPTAVSTRHTSRAIK